MKVYGIKSCSSVKKALSYLDAHAIAYDFVDLKQEKIELSTIKRWLEYVPIEQLFNKRSTTYRNLKLKELNLGDSEAIEWLPKEPMLIKRPVIEEENVIMVGFDLDKYNQKLL
ncbi:MAG: arsenate reductase [Sulfurovum sp. PC08-66]|jgi:Spx/MgsR family transcriptional regulator|nr:MAG: arsenate reductase [Sulfurovum sp. PC08-66]